MVPAGSAQRFVIPRVHGPAIGWPGAVNRRDSRANQGGVEPPIGRQQVDPLVDPDLLACHGRSTCPSVVRRTCGVGTPAAQAASWNVVAGPTSSSLDRSKFTFTA